jgi:hypothetical protein
MSRIACACSVDSSKFSIRPARAWSGSLDARISWMTASMFDSAISRPSRMWARRSAR